VEVTKQCKVDSDECVNNAACLNGICTAYFSLDDGAVITQNPEPKLCKSNYLQKFEDGVKCTGFFWMGEVGNYETNGTDLKCNYNVTAINTTEAHNPGVCALDGTAKQYCYHPGTNSDLWISNTKQLNDWYNGGALKQHTMRRRNWGPEVQSTSVKVAAFPQLLNADKCTLKYYKAYAGASLATISVAFLGLLFFLF